MNLLHLVDIGMVGHLGDSALAATGIGSFSNYLAISFIIGLPLCILRILGTPCLPVRIASMMAVGMSWACSAPGCSACGSSTASTARARRSTASGNGATASGRRSGSERLKCAIAGRKYRVSRGR